MARITALLAFLAWGAWAQELQILEPHRCRGERGAEVFDGELRIGSDAQYQLERRFESGRIEAESGLVAVVEKGLLLSSSDGSARFYERDDSERRVRWRWQQGESFELLVQPGRRERALQMGLRVLGSEGALAWLLETNVGWLDEEAGLLRSRQPSARALDRLVAEHGIRTVLSLNGELDAQEWYFPGPDASAAERARGPRQLSLNERIAELGLEHVRIGMSASRAPREEELAEAFRVLLDPARAPVLVHCKGGADRTGVVCALYAMEFQAASREEADATMRKHMWASWDGTEILGAYLDLYQPGSLRALLRRHGLAVPERRAGEGAPKR